MIMINAWSIRRGIKRVENVQNGRFDSRFPQLSFAFLIFAASPIMSGIVRFTVLYARARANYGNPCKFNKYSYLMDLIRFTNVYTEPECWHLSSVRSWFPKLRCFQPNQLLFHFDVEAKTFIYQPIDCGVGGSGEAIRNRIIFKMSSVPWIICCGYNFHSDKNILNKITMKAIVL